MSTSPMLQHLEAMQAALLDPKLSLPLKTQQFGTEAQSLRLNLLELSRQETASDVRQATTAARNLIRPALSSNPVVALRQSAAIAGLDDKLEKLEASAHVSADKAPDPFLGRPFQAIMVYTAVLRHMGDFIPAALAAVLIDIVPLPLLLLKVVAYDEIYNGRTRQLAAAQRFTVAEVIEARELVDLLLGSPFPDSSMRQLRGQRVVTRWSFSSVLGEGMAIASPMIVAHRLRLLGLMFQ